MFDDVTCDEVNLEGLLGVDSIQYFAGMTIGSCLGGMAFMMRDGVVPFGNVDSFLTEKQLTLKYGRTSQTPIQNQEVTVEQSVVNFVLNPNARYCDPIGSVCDEVVIEPNLDNMFKLDSIGIKPDSALSDQPIIDKFKENISLENGKYHVELPWNEKLSNVKNNFNVCHKIVNRVVENLYRDGLYDQYSDVLEQQIKDDILEPISLKNLDLNKHIFIVYV